MYTTYIGGQFLKLYNQKTGRDMSAKQFFNDIMFPLFFDNDKYFMQVQNSSFDQIYKQKKHKEQAKRKEALITLNEKIAKLSPDVSTAVGYPAADPGGTTAGQVTSINHQFTEDEIFASWIGGGLGVGVSGGYILFLDNNQVLWNLYEGWERYRKYLDQTPNLKSNQITTWNGQWLAGTVDHDGQKYFSLDGRTKNANNIESIETIQWSRLLFALAAVSNNQNSLMAYACNFGQMNESLGFVELRLGDVNNLFQLRQKITGVTDQNKFTLLYETKKSFRKACQLGVIGLQALEPKDLEIEKPVNIKKLRAGDEETVYQYNNNLIWRIAMLNNQQSLELAQQFANLLKAYSGSGDKGKTAHKNLVESLLISRSKSKIIDQLADILKGLGAEGKAANAQLLNKVVEEVSSMNLERLRIFISLTRYVYYSL